MMQLMLQSQNHPRILVVVPAYNEAGCIGDVVQDIRQFGFDEVLVVDDGSVDRTYILANQAGAQVLHLPFNLGIGGAVQGGLKFAAEQGYDFVVRLDGDGQHRVDEAVKLLDAVRAGQADVAIGSRFVPGHQTYKAPLSRSMGIYWFALMVSMIVRQRVYDTTSGMQALNRRAVRILANNYPQDYPEVEARVVMYKHGLRVIELPVRMEHRKAGMSSITFVRAIYYMFKVSLATLMSTIRRTPKSTPEEV